MRINQLQNDDPCPREWLSRLSRFIPRVYVIAFMSLMAWGFQLYRVQAQHPTHWPVTILLILIAVSYGGQTVFLLGRRWHGHSASRSQRTLGVWLGMTCSLSAIAWATAYSLQVTRAKHIPDRLVLRWCAAIGSTLADLEKSIRYRYRYVGKRVELFTQEPVQEAVTLVASADKHLEALERELGSPMPTRVHWVRGTLLGRGDVQFLGMAMSGIRKDPRSGVVLFTELDRHELAHFAIHGRIGADAMPPFLLIEGWAQARQGASRQSLCFDAWRTRYEGQGPWQLEQLIADPWYERDDGPVYSIGGAFVDYLLHRYGVHKFKDLYLNATKPTFTSQIQSTYGKSLSALEADMWQEIQTVLKPNPMWIDPTDSPSSVDPNLWHQIAIGVNQLPLLDGQHDLDREAWNVQWKSTSIGNSVGEGHTDIWWTSDRWHWYSESMNGSSRTAPRREEHVTAAFSVGDATVVERYSEDSPWSCPCDISNSERGVEYARQKRQMALKWAIVADHPGYYLSSVLRQYEVIQIIDQREREDQSVEIYLRHRDEATSLYLIMTLAPSWQWRLARLEMRRDRAKSADQVTSLEWQPHRDSYRLHRRSTTRLDENRPVATFEQSMDYHKTSDVSDPVDINGFATARLGFLPNWSVIEWFFFTLTVGSGLGCVRYVVEWPTIVSSNRRAIHGAGSESTNAH